VQVFVVFFLKDQKYNQIDLIRGMTSGDAEYEVSFDNKADFNKFVRNIPVLSAIIVYKPRSVYELAKLTKIDVSNLNKTIQLKALETPEYFTGEKYFILGRINEVLQNHGEATEQYLIASQEFKKQGFAKKQMKASLNKIICEEYISNSVDFNEYSELLRSVVKIRDRSSIGIILNNIAFKLMFLGAYKTANKLLTKSLRFLMSESISINYQIAELNLAHLHRLMGHLIQSGEVAKRLIGSSFPEISVAAQLLVQMDVDSSKLTEGWRWRLERKLSSLEELTDFEDRLIGCLALRSKSKSEIIHALW
jgi:tetratricopeptide (TPR) repeat protein